MLTEDPDAPSVEPPLERTLTDEESLDHPIPDGFDVVVTNPTHYAVALKYDDTMAAPKVIAKGADLLALKIRDLARDAKVPVLQAPPCQGRP